jgi:hypothetical protein
VLQIGRQGKQPDARAQQHLPRSPDLTHRARPRNVLVLGGGLENIEFMANRQQFFFP